MTAEQKLKSIGYFSLFSLLLFFYTYYRIHHVKGGDLLFLMVIIPLLYLVSGIVFSRMRALFLFVVYLVLFSFVHFIVFHPMTGLSDVFWILAWCIVPSICSYSICETVWQQDPARH